jgi:DNA-binding transcriptional LysR family regulator
VFLAVVETGFFTGAARKLGRATPAVSSTVANLEMELGVKLFDREHTRRPALTDAAAILSKCKAVSVGVDDLRASVKGVLDGLEAELSVVIDVTIPSSRVANAVKTFETNFPTVKLRLYMEALSAVGQLVQRGVASVGFGGAGKILAHVGLGHVAPSDPRQQHCVFRSEVGEPPGTVQKDSSVAPFVESRANCQHQLTVTTHIAGLARRLFERMRRGRDGDHFHLADAYHFQAGRPCVHPAGRLGIP